MGLLWLALDQVMGCCLPSHRNSPSPVPVVRTDSRPSLSPRMEEMVAETAPQSEARPGNLKKRAPGSLAFVPSAAGLILAGEVICDLTGCRNG